MQAHTLYTHVHVCVEAGTSHSSSWHLNSAAPSAKWREKRMEKLHCSSWGQFWRQNPCWVSKVKTWNMCLNRCPHSALQWYVLLPESNKGRRGKSAQTYLHKLTVYSWASANVVLKMDPNKCRCSLIKITLFPLVLISYTYKQICLLCIDFMDKHTDLHTHTCTCTPTHKCKHTGATINYSHPIWEH